MGGCCGGVRGSCLLSPFPAWAIMRSKDAADATADHDAGGPGFGSRATAPRREKRWGRRHGQNGQVPRFEPFRAVRYAPTVDLDAVIAPPYDVLSDADVDAPRRPATTRNIVHVDVPRGGDRYARPGGPAALAGSPAACFVRDDEPTFTLYRMRFTDAAGRAARILVGVLGGLEVVDEGAGGVPAPRAHHPQGAPPTASTCTRATDANLSPVWGLSLAGGLTALLDGSPASRSARSTVDGVEHVVERVMRPRPPRRHPRATSGATTC